MDPPHRLRSHDRYCHYVRTDSRTKRSRAVEWRCRIGYQRQMTGEVAMPYSLEELSDRLEINDTIIRYVHALDDHEIDVLDTVFAPDCKFDFSSVSGPCGSWAELKPTLFA